MKMTPKHLIHDHPPFAFVIDELVLVNDQTYVREPFMADARRRPSYANLLVPFSVAGSAFLA